MREKDIKKITFKTRYGHYEFFIMDLMNRVCKSFLNKSIIVFIDEILIYSKRQQEHGKHLQEVLEVLKKEKLYTNFSKYDLWIREVQFLGHVVNHEGIMVYQEKIEAVMKWE